MNGTDRSTLNVYGSSGEPYRESGGVYSYPRDFETVERRTREASQDWAEIVGELYSQGIAIPQDAKLVPIYSHRFVLCEHDHERSLVLSLDGTDTIVYGASLKEYLEKEFLKA